MNAAVAKLADAAANPGRARNAAVPLREIGLHPTSGAALRLLDGKYGPYVSDGTTNATMPKGSDGMALTIEAAVEMLAARAAAGSPKGVRKAPVRRKGAAPRRAAG